MFIYGRVHMYIHTRVRICGVVYGITACMHGVARMDETHACTYMPTALHTYEHLMYVGIGICLHTQTHARTHTHTNI